MSSLLFVVTEEKEVGGFTAAARVPNTNTTLRTEGDSLKELYINIAEVVDAYYTATNTPIQTDITVKSSSNSPSW